MTNASGRSHLSTAGLMLTAAVAASISCSGLPQVDHATQLAPPACDAALALAPEVEARVARSRSSRIHIEPDQFISSARGDLIIGRSGLLRPGSGGRMYDLVGAVRVQSDSVVSQYPLPGGDAEYSLVRGLELPTGLSLITSHSTWRDPAAIVSVSTAQDGRTSLLSSHAMPWNIRYSHVVTDPVRLADGFWIAGPELSRGPTYHAVRLLWRPASARVDSIPLLGDPDFMVAIPTERSDDALLAYSAIRFAEGRFRPRAVILTRSRPTGGTVEHTILRESSEFVPGLLRVVSAADRLTLLWLESQQGSTISTRLAGVESRDDGETWEDLPTLDLPAGALSFTVSQTGLDTLTVAMPIGEQRTSIGLAHMTTAGWSALVSITRQHPVSTPVLASRTSGGFRVVYGSVDGPIESSIPSLRIAVGRWRCE